MLSQGYNCEVFGFLMQRSISPMCEDGIDTGEEIERSLFNGRAAAAPSLPHAMHSTRLMRPAASSKVDDARRHNASSSSLTQPPAEQQSLAHTLASAFTRIGFDDEWNPAGVAASAGSDSGDRSDVPRVELLRELEWIDGAAGALSDPARDHLRGVFTRLTPAHTLTPHQLHSYGRLELSDRIIADEAELDAAVRSLDDASTEGCDGTGEEDDLDAIEREIAALTTQNARLDDRLSSLDLSRRQLDARRLQIAAQKSAMQSQWDAEAERDATDAQKSAGASSPSPAAVHSNRIHSAQELASEVSAANGEYNDALHSIQHAARQIETLITKGRYNENAAARPNKDDQQQQQHPHQSALLGVGVHSALPSLSSDGLSAFDTDTFGQRSGAALSNGSPVVASSEHEHAAVASSTASSVDSPFLLHHPSLLSAYLAKDDAWARSLNALFRAQFGSPASASSAAADGSVEPVSRLQQTVAMLQHDSEGTARTEMDDVIAHTPHAKHMPRTPRTLRARNSVAAPKTSLRPVHEHEDEEKQQQNGHSRLQRQISFTTPPHAARPAVASVASSAPPVSSSSLSPALHAQYTSELRRLYDSFPDSQQFWLLSNLDYLGQKARVAQQHSSMVSEQTTRALGRRGINESIAEAAVQVAAATESLSIMLTTPPPNSSSTLDPSVQSFPALWSRLRSLQLLEVLRVDLSYKFRRQSEYVCAQRRIVSALLEQRARHEMILVAQRWAMERMEATRDVLHAAWADLAADSRRLAARLGAYQQMQAMHAGAKAITATSRLGIDARAGIVVRAARMAESGERTLRNMHASSAPPPPPPAQNPASAAGAAAGAIAGGSSSSSSSAASVLSFDSLLSSAQYLSCYPATLAARMASQESTRSAHLAALRRCGVRARQAAFVDAQDVCVGDSDSARHSRRLQQPRFARDLHRTDVAVDRAAAGLNVALQSHAQIRSKLHPPESSSAVAGGDAAQVEREVRAVWSEFIHAPDLLEQRIRRMQQKIKEAESR